MTYSPLIPKMHICEKCHSSSSFRYQLTDGLKLFEISTYRWMQVLLDVNLQVQNLHNLAAN
jgi:hypothetical protein